MKKIILLSILLIVGCEELGVNEQQISDGTAVTDTLYIFNYDTLIITNYDTTIVYDTLIINQACDGGATIDDCGVCSGGTTGLEVNYLKDCNDICGGGAIIDDCGICSGGTSWLGSKLS